MHVRLNPCQVTVLTERLATADDPPSRIVLEALRGPDLMLDKHTEIIKCHLVFLAGKIMDESYTYPPQHHRNRWCKTDSRSLTALVAKIEKALAK